MAGFKLGRIIGEKGDQGPKGDTGARGEKGEKGDNGKDGLTPVFSVEKTVTLNPGEEAYVEINCEDPSEPALSFYIPAGHNGQDATGDMLSSIYDKDGIGSDVFEYARELFGKCLETTGGTMQGTLKSAVTLLGVAAVRNISAGSSIPENGAEGDIHLVTKTGTYKKLGDCVEGDIILLEENGKEEPYIVLGEGHYISDGITLIRKNISLHKGRYNAIKKTTYSMSEADIFLETIYKSAFPEKVRKELMTAEVEIGVYRQCFLLKKNDYTTIGYLSEESNRIAKRGNEAQSYITSTVNSQGNVVSINTSGGFSTTSFLTETYYRPSVILPSDLRVENTEYENAPAVKMPSEKCGIYIFMDNEWKECISQ